MPRKDPHNYFSHDADARNDEKIIRLRMRHGAEGYGIYFMILERLRGETDYMSVKDYNMIAFDLRVDSARVKSVVEDFGLFVFTEDGKYFYSESFLRRMELKDTVSRKRREAIARRWGRGVDPATPPEPAGNAPGDTKVIQMYPDGDTKVTHDGYNKNKGKENKIIKKISPDGDTKKSADTAPSVAADGDLEKDIPSGLSPKVADMLRRVLAMADMLAADSGLPAADIRSTAVRVAREWDMTGEYSRKDPVTHLRNVVLKILRSRPAAPPPQGRCAPPPGDVRAAEREAEQRERDEIYSRDSAAELAAYLRSRGLSPGDSVTQLVSGSSALPETQNQQLP